MKIVVIISIILVILAIFLPVFFFIDNPFSEENIENNSSNADNSGEPIPTAGVDCDTTVKVLIDGSVTEMNMRDYLVGVVGAEMPAAFEEEALKAQAVAARTYTLYKMLVAPSDRHPEADVCNDITCCKAYSSLETLQEHWGESYEMYRNKITSAVAQTDGTYISYEDQPILAVFHSSSAGVTEASENVWGSSLPYLKSVESPETGSDVPNYTYTVSVAFSDFTETVTASYPEAAFGEDRTAWISDIQKTDSGRILSLKIGGAEVSGTALRNLFGLRSTAVDIEITDEGVVMTTTGYGHGVGMSQYGANTLAREGHSYEEILQWYYSGVALSNMAELF